jgi:3-phenylpropionate/trans-cinnamate dioxygenase ferredoxin reductase subunit
MRCVLVGGGVAAAATAAALRRRGYDGEIVLVSEEPDAPYERPPLSKDVLAGGDVVPARKPEWYGDNGVELRLSTRVTSLDIAARTVRFADGDDLGYDTLVLATGVRARRLAGFEGERIHYLRTAADARALRADLAAAECSAPGSSAARSPRRRSGSASRSRSSNRRPRRSPACSA